MVYPLLKRMLTLKYLSGATWVSLGVQYPPRVKAGNILVTHVEIPEKVLGEYTTFKENLWSHIHGLGGGNIFEKGYEAYASVQLGERAGNVRALERSRRILRAGFSAVTHGGRDRSCPRPPS